MHDEVVCLCVHAYRPTIILLYAIVQNTRTISTVPYVSGDNFTATEETADTCKYHHHNI